jgi:hypothetical protein
MRPIGLAFAVALTVGGCSLLFNGNDLKGHGGDGGAGSGGTGGGGDDMGGGGGGAGGGGSGGGGGTQCTPRTTVTFTKRTPSVAANDPNYIALGDIDHDGHVDIVTANYSSASFSVLLGVGDGSFGLASSTPINTGAGPQIVIARDVTGDGLDDVIVSSFTSTGPASSVNVYVNQSTPGMVKFAAAKPLTIPNQMQLYWVAVGNFDGDTKPDIMLDDPNSNTARFYTGVGDGSFTPSFTVASTNKGAKWLSAADLNSDGRDDVVVFNDTDDDMTLFLSSPVSGGYVASRLAFDPTNMGTLYFVKNPPSLVDINGDGLLDILVASGTITPGTVEKFVNSGTATAPAFPNTPADINTGDAPVAQGFADFNCDGTLDIVASTLGCSPGDQNCPPAQGEPPVMWLLPGHGTGYDAAQTTSVGAGPWNLAIGDFNEDGYPDVALAGDGTTITVLVNGP